MYGILSELIDFYFKGSILNPNLSAADYQVSFNRKKNYKRYLENTLDTDPESFLFCPLSPHSNYSFSSINRSQWYFNYDLAVFNQNPKPCVVFLDRFSAE